MNNLTLYTASTQAVESNHLFIGLLAVTGAVVALVAGLMILYMAKYREGSGIDRGKLPQKTWRLEVAWTTVTLMVFFGLFIWGASLYVRMRQPPPGAMVIDVVGKQWMWKVEHPGGQREINTLHVPVGRDIELLMTSQDVIHDLAIPAFRIRYDVLPGRYESLWFHPTRIGTYEFYCDQLCGTDHSQMDGVVVVMSQPDFQAWLQRNGTSGGLIAQGRNLFINLGCAGCHEAGGRGGDGTVRAPNLDGVYGSPVPLSDGHVIIADDQYLRDSILQPKRQVVAGFAPKMPSFAGKISDQDLTKLVAYIKSLATPHPTGAGVRG